MWYSTRNVNMSRTYVIYNAALFPHSERHICYIKVLWLLIWSTYPQLYEICTHPHPDITLLFFWELIWGGSTHFYCFPLRIPRSKVPPKKSYIWEKGAYKFHKARGTCCRLIVRAQYVASTSFTLFAVRFEYCLHWCVTWIQNYALQNCLYF